MSLAFDATSAAMAFLVSLPLLQAVALYCVPSQNQSRIATLSLTFASLTLMGALLSFGWVLLYGPLQTGWLTFDRMTALIVSMIALLGLIVQRFSVHYMQTDLNYRSYYQKLACLIGMLLCFVSAQNVLLMSVAWVGMSTTMLALLQHQALGTVSATAGAQARQVFRAGDAAFVAAAFCFVMATGSFQIAAGLNALHHPSWWSALAAGLWVLAAFTKTANFPFCRWLPNTMMAPSTVSAIMHAGFVNSGAVLITKLAGLYVHFPQLLLVVFVVGAITALFGAWAMLVQTDIKRYLAYSTIGQMGFMMMQCGLGVYSAAIFHLLAHGLFKSSLFLGAGSIIQKNRDKQFVHAHDQTDARQFMPQKRLVVPASFLSPATLWGVVIFVFGLAGLFAVVQAMDAGDVGLSDLYSDSAALLLLFPALALLPLTCTMLEHPVSLARIAQSIGTGAMLLMLYVGFEHGMHAFLSLHVTNADAMPIGGWSVFTVVFALVSLLFVLSAVLSLSDRLGRPLMPASLKARLYVWLLNQSAVPTVPGLMTVRPSQSVR